MEEQKHVIFIKNMVCNRCILVIKQILKDLQFTPLQVDLGTAVVKEELTSDDREVIRKALEEYGFELIDDKRQRIIEQIRTSIIQLVHYEGNLSKLKLSEYLKEKCHYDYSFLSKLFTEMNGISIEKYYIAQKVERIKELLFYDELSISEIADKLQYSSVAHLSTQFRNVTGMSPSEFKRLKEHGREPLDKV
ncbi:MULTISPECIES: AraC family transcriptional regulator [Butyricimonas]|jgi:transcriptional regulator, araC family|uniref:Helix-turn-helix domain-containing protein n=1 Tax=Butyricimonas hominis TaxID=2763032 RepID=A0ABR7CYC1_9BACT|nr:MULTISPECIES: AraC family transcriptional regulator [Butyricimonas]MBC5620639.1 helix-turn-helix domain-containing protein [Butyricimonas hominis]MCB6970824.1 AraC family transcriptional regulator [Butyricimonas synergistica]MCG4517538.1 AraC family transcriptional regulator [Butyricimonas sp. DFI.6.44]